MTSEILEFINEQRSGWSLAQAFYISPEIFEIDRAWMAKEWFVLGHASELPEPNAYIVRELLGESLILTRDSQGAVHAFYNVCRHRGSRICRGDGRRKLLVCPYHAWSYQLDGVVRAAPAVPESVDLKPLGLKPVLVRELHGLLMVSLAGDPIEVEAWAAAKRDVLQFHGLDTARIAARERFEIQGNWKLVIENALECYHCLPAHPEYSSVMRHVDAYGKPGTAGEEAWRAAVKAWQKTSADPGHPAAAERWPIGEGWLTQSQDGRPVAPLMGRQSRFDGGVCGAGGTPFFSIMLLNDHAIVVQILPSGPETTLLIFDWLVDARAQDHEVDLARLRWLWDATTLQDKRIIEDNAAGIRSAAYEPGPYASLEDLTAGFVGFYLREITAHLTGAAKTPMLQRRFQPESPPSA